MLDNVTHPGLRALLEFEAMRHQVPIEYEEVTVIPPAPALFVPRVEVRAYRGRETGRADLLGVVYDGPWANALDSADEEVRVGDVVVGVVAGNRIVLRFSLETLFRSFDGADRQDGPLPANRVLEAVFLPAMQEVLRNIRDHDWSSEAEDHARRKVALLDRSTEYWRREMERCRRDMEEKTYEMLERDWNDSAASGLRAPFSNERLSLDLDGNVHLPLLPTLARTRRQDRGRL